MSKYLDGLIFFIVLLMFFIDIEVINSLFKKLINILLEMV